MSTGSFAGIILAIIIAVGVGGVFQHAMANVEKALDVSAASISR